MSQPANQNHSAAEPQHAGLPPPQFRLATLMVSVTALCGVLAASLVLPPLTTFGLILLSLAIVAHVAGTFCGTRLRDQSSRLIRQRRLVRPPPPPSADEESPSMSAAAPNSRLTERAPLGVALSLFVIAGMVVAIAAGSYWLASSQERSLAWTDYAMGSFAFGVLGGIWGFMIGGFLCVGYRAARQALQYAKDPDA